MKYLRVVLLIGLIIGISGVVNAEPLTFKSVWKPFGERMDASREKRRVLKAERDKQNQQEMKYRQARVKEIYTGESGVQGDLLRVTIRGGEIAFYGKHRNYSPVSFKITDGERKIITFHHPEKRRYKIEVPIEYYNGVLSFDYDPNSSYGNDYRHNLIYEPEWRRGKYYKHITLHDYSNSRARNIEIIVEAIDFPRRH